MDRKALVYKGVPPNICIGDTTLRILPNGEYIIIFETGGATEPVVENHIRICRSADQGNTWSQPEVVLQLENRACLPSEVLVDGMELTLFLQEHDGRFGRWDNYIMRSHDGGHTWDEPERCVPFPKRGMLRNRFIRSDGAWVFPLEYFPPLTDDAEMSIFDDKSHWHSASQTVITKDRGLTWEHSNIIDGPVGWAESNLAQLSDGRLVMLCRTDDRRGCLLRSESVDGGKTWSPYVNSDIPNPGTKFRIFMLKNGTIALVHNPNPKVRNPLALWLSNDDMKTWYYQRILTDFPGLLQYPDGVLSEDEKHILFAFDYNRHDLIFWDAELP